MDQSLNRNFYAEHLVEVNKLNPVITTQNLCNSLGAMVIPKGTYVTQDVADKISKFDLSYPLELQVNLETALSPNQIFSDILLTRKNFLGDKKHQTATKELVRLCGFLQSHPLITQKITVFSQQMPERYGDTQSATGFAVLIGLHLGLNEESLEVIFTAAQMHDTGLLNIDPQLVASMDKVSFKEKQALYVKQITLGKLFLDNIPTLSDKVSKAVFMHNERKDGSGWPEGIIGDKNSIEGQVVGVGVMLHEIYSKKLKPRGYGTRHLLPLLQMEAEGLDQNIFNSALEILRQGALGKNQIMPTEFMPNLSKYLLSFQSSLITWVVLAKEFCSEIYNVKPTLEAQRSLAIISGLEELNRNSGIWEQNIQAWLKDSILNGRQEDYADIELVGLMLEAVHSKLKCLQWTMHESAIQIDHEWARKCANLESILNKLPIDYFTDFETYLESQTA